MRGGRKQNGTERLEERFGGLMVSIIDHPVEPFSSRNTEGLNKILARKLRAYALVFERIQPQLATSSSNAWLRYTELLRWHSVCHRDPSYYDKDNGCCSWKGTSRDFHDAFGKRKDMDLKDSVSLINDPRNEMAKLYTINHLCNVWGGGKMLCVNAPIGALEKAVIAGYKANSPILFDCDLKFEDRATGILDGDLFGLDTAYGETLSVMTKAERLQTGDACMQHAMVITAVHLDDEGKAVRYKVENSWGAKVGDEGWWMMTAQWFNDNVLHVSIPRPVVEEKWLAILVAGNPLVLPTWDPMMTRTARPLYNMPSAVAGSVVSPWHPNLDIIELIALLHLHTQRTTSCAITQREEGSSEEMMQAGQDVRTRPTGFHPLEARRPRSSPALRDMGEPKTLISTLLISALALASIRPWITSSRRDDTAGGEGWVVLAYWGWRIWHDWRSSWRRRNVKRREPVSEPAALDLISVAVAVVLAIQSLAFVFSVGAVGATRSTIILIAASLVSASSVDSPVANIRILPVVLAALYLTYDASSTSFISTIALVTFAATTAVLAGPLANRRAGAQPKDKPNSAIDPKLNLIGALTAMLLILGLSQVSIIPQPFPAVLQPNAHLVGAVYILLLARFIPLPTLSSRRKLLCPLASRRDQSIVIVAVAALQFFALPPSPTRIDALVLLPLTFVSIFAAQPAKPAPHKEASQWTFPQPVSTSTGWSAMSILPIAWRPHLQTILRTPTSSKIFYFLLLNLAYMGVQMAYGVLTNSLGLISDSIHMLFDCLGLGVGLWASVAATWKPGGRYTYGYSRVETLSGFANGLFLILISIFIIFEAIQRVLDPPEMETQQLLLVSSIGLAINLWGMYATGGHHHHGHSHGHGHDHGHDHGHSHGHHHVPVNEKKVDHRHVNGDHHAHDHHDHDDHKSHSHSQHANNDHHDHDHHDHDHGSHSHSHDHHAHSHKHDDTCDNAHSHSHSHAQDHGLTHAHESHSHGHDHAHSHNMRGVFLHVLADTLGSVGVIISTILIRWTGWTGFDPLASLFIAGLIMASVIPLVIDSGKVLCLDVGSATEEQIRVALSELSGVNGLSSYSAPRFWPRCEGEISGSIHIQLGPSPSSIDPFRSASLPGLHKDVIYADAEKVVARVEKVLKGRIRGLSELVIQVEGSEERTFCGCMTSAS